jgi:hypothetical protein
MIDVAQRLQEKFDAWLAAVKAEAVASGEHWPIDEDRAFDLWLGKRLDPEDAYQVLIDNDE